jgi:hypothetical protein
MHEESPQWGIGMLAVGIAALAVLVLYGVYRFVKWVRQVGVM